MLLENDDDRQKFISIYNKYHAQLEKVSINILSDSKDAEDAVQNTWVQVIKHYHKIPEIPCEQLLFWLISIVKNESLKVLRKKRKNVPLEDWDAVTESSDNIMDYNELVKLFTKLPETYRTTLEMKFLLQYTEKEIAQHLCISETAVSTRVNRGRALIRKIIEMEGFVYDRK